MRALRLATAASIIAIAAPAGAALPQLALACGSAQAGQDVPCTISRVAGGRGVYVLFQTYDGTAKAGTDYTAVSKQVYLSAGTSFLAVAVHTLVNPNATGTLTFNAAVAGGVVVVRSTGNIVEPPPPPPATQVCPDGTVLPATSVCPPVVTPPSPPAPITGLPDIPSNFDINTELVPTALPGTALPDDSGAFRFLCNAGQVLADDPIVYPGQPGKSHLHQFYGNTGANAYSTYSSLRQTGQSTCVSPLNRSAYWMPAMLDGKGNVVRPDYVSIYYKRLPSSDPRVSDPTNAQYQGKGIALPNGLRFIMGFNMLNPTDPPTGLTYFNCDGPTGTPGHYPDLTTALANCPAGNRVGAIIFAPSCWNGTDLDSADHRSHVAFPTYQPYGYKRCPDGYPYVIPTFTLGAWYSIVAGDDTSKWSLSSDAMFPNLPKGSTFHADWFGAWDNTTMSMWMDNCINKLLSCSAANLGNGYMEKMYSGFTWNANPRLVPVP